MLHELPAHPVELAANIIDDVAGLERVGQHVPGVSLDLEMTRQRLLLVKTQSVLDGETCRAELPEIIEEHRDVNVRAPFARPAWILLEGGNGVVDIKVAI